MAVAPSKFGNYGRMRESKALKNSSNREAEQTNKQTAMTQKSQNFRKKNACTHTHTKH